MSITAEITETNGESFAPEDTIDLGGRTYRDWRDEFHENGFVVLNNVISLERAKYYADKQLEWLKKFGLGFVENDESTWLAEHMPISFKGGRYCAYGVTHEKSVWEARSEPAVIAAFEKLWETKELLCSFDGINISLPRRKDVKWTPWPHCDHNPDRKGMESVQGLLNFAPCGPDDGGLIVMKGSAKLFNEFFSEKREEYYAPNAPKFEWKHPDHFMFDEKHMRWFRERGCEMVKLNLGPGDLVLWDSRVIHHACFPEGNQIRHAQYICMTPRRLASSEALEMKRYCFKNYLATDHWPHCNIYPATEKPLRNGEVCPKDRTEPFEKPILTDTILKLAGVRAY